MDDKHHLRWVRRTAVSKRGLKGALVVGFKWPRCSVLKVVCNKLMNHNAALAYNLGRQPFDCREVMLFEKGLTGNVGVLISIFEDYANPI